MGCVGAIDDTSVYNLSNYKSRNNAKKQQNKNNEQQSMIQRVKICSVNLAEYFSPFEFFLKNYKDIDQTKKYQSEEYKLNKKFMEISQLYDLNIQDDINRDFVADKIKLHELTSRRYKRFSPLYNSNVGIKDQNFLINTQQFFQLWDAKFEQIRAKSIQLSYVIDSLSKQNGTSYADRVINYLRWFDLICYHTILAYVYNHMRRGEGKNPIQDLQQITKYNFANKYKFFMDKKFQGPLVNLFQKIRKLKKFVQMNEFHIVFLQEVSKEGLKWLRQQLGYYRIVYSKVKSTVILVNEVFSQKLQRKQKNLTLYGLNYKYIQSQLKAHRQQALKQVQNETKKWGQIRNDGNKLERDRKGEVGRKKSLKEDKQRDGNSPLLPKIKSQNRTAVKQKKKTNVFISDKKEVNTKSMGINQKQKIKEKTISSILYREDKMKNEFSLFKNNVKNKNYRFGSESVVQFIGCLILVSVCFKDSKGGSSMKKLKKDIEYYQQIFPDHHIIIGFNTHINKKNSINKVIDQMKRFRTEEYSSQQQGEEQMDKKKIYFTPNLYEAVPGIIDNQKCVVGGRKLKKLAEKKGFFTTLSKKTLFNVNPYECGQQYMGVDSFIISNNKPIKSSIMDCQGNQINQDCKFYKNKQYLPNIDHPFTDFFVCCSLNLELKYNINFESLNLGGEDEAQDQNDLK